MLLRNIAPGNIAARFECRLVGAALLRQVDGNGDGGPPERRPPLRSRPKLSSRQREAGRREVGWRRAGCAARSRSGRQWMSPGRDNGEHALVGARGGTPWPARPECRARGNGSTTLAIAGGRGRGATRGELLRLVPERKRARRAQAGRYLRVQPGSTPPCPAITELVPRRARRLPLPRRVTEIVAPCLHQPAPSFEQVRARIRPFDATHSMCKRRFGHLAWRPGTLSAPIPER